MASPRTTPRPWLAYSLLRLAFFAGPLLLIWGLSRNLVISAVFAAVIGLCLSVVLLDSQRGAVAVRLDRWAARRQPASDEAAEDRAVDGDGAQSASAPASERP